MQGKPLQRKLGHINKSTRVTSPESSSTVFSHLDLSRKYFLSASFRLLAVLVLVSFDTSGCNAVSEAEVAPFQNLTIGVMISTTGPKKLGEEALSAIDLSLQVGNATVRNATRMDITAGYSSVLELGVCHLGHVQGLTMKDEASGSDTHKESKGHQTPDCTSGRTYGSRNWSKPQRRKVGVFLLGLWDLLEELESK
ncbi:hypothetical protein PoB_004675100 [Plakobranchus ocellatus]|uniref:Uncharacterized protein n=1 Tax=Plakobranchus ocellatus TaxID=259542 RepID=A0AAV4BA77_9GAST|nr:hypothetical protein PoB_004675100 [Plakobranchus ocellatus]